MALKVVTSNIKFDDHLNEKQSWKNRRSLLAKLINNFEPDLLATQEGLKPQLDELKAKLANLNLVCQHRNWIKERMYPCVYYNPKKIQLINSGDIWLSETPNVPGSVSFNSTFPRLCTWAHLQEIESKRELIFASIHLDHILEETRKKQVTVFIDEMKKINTDNLPIILCGDFNESPFGSVREEINKHFPSLYDPWIRLNKKEETSYHDFSGKMSNGQRIDWILADKTFQAESIYLDKDCEEDIYPSDHFLVKAVFN